MDLRRASGDTVVLVAFVALTASTVAASRVSERISVHYDVARFDGALYERSVEPCFQLPGVFDGVSAESYPPNDSLSVRGLPDRRKRVRDCFAVMPGATIRVRQGAATTGVPHAVPARSGVAGGRGHRPGGTWARRGGGCAGTAGACGRAPGDDA